MNAPFSLNAPRIIFGSVSDLPPLITWQRIAMVASTSSATLADTLESSLGNRVTARINGAVQHVPRSSIEDAQNALPKGIDGIIAIGGGSATGLGKALAVQNSVPLAVVPTTLSGSEMTPIFGITEGGRKHTNRDPRALPTYVVYDPTATVLPPALIATSGMNAIAHCIEALYAQNRNPLATLLAEAGLEKLVKGLPPLAATPTDPNLFADCLYGAMLAGLALATADMALHHKICHALGGAFGANHGKANAVMLPYVVRFNESAAGDTLDNARRILDAESVSAGLASLVQRLGASGTLADLGINESDIDALVSIVLDPPPSNPRPVDAESLRELLLTAGPMP